MSTLVINPTSVISTYCYSIFRLEPASACEHACLYCYARWYRFSNDKLTERHVREFKLFLKVVQRTRPRRLIPFRLSTLVDPFQSSESCMKLSVEFLKLCSEHEIPVIVNTKSDRVLSDQVLEQLIKLHEKGLVLVQITIPFLNEEVAAKLEPRAPPPSRRLEVVEKLAREHGIPVAVRIQPMIPTVIDHEYAELVREIARAGAKHVMTESLRVDGATLNKLREVLPALVEVKWAFYTGEGSVLMWPDREWRRRITERIREVATQLGLRFATCKEEFLDLWTAPDCCGMYLMRSERVGLRLTVREVALTLGEQMPDSLEKLWSAAESLSERERYLTQADIDALPREVRKKVLGHYKMLLKVLASERGRELVRIAKSVAR